MRVAFKRTGERRYAVIVSVPGQPEQSIHPAPGYDDDIPHDLVHYVVEAELKLASGVFGRADRGGGSFISQAGGELSAREQARQRRRQRKREAGLRDEDHAGDMLRSERLAALCDLSWRRHHGQRPDPLRKPPEPLEPDDASKVERVVARLDQLAPLWRALPVGAALTFEWPSASPF